MVLLSDYLSDHVVTQVETESVMVSAFNAILTFGVLTGMVVAFNKMYAEVVKQ